MINSEKYPNSFIANTSVIVGNVIIGNESSVFYNAVIRGDNSVISIGNQSNIQDNCVLHCEKMYSTTIGNNVTVGHSAILHGCTVEDNVLVGMGSIIMDGSIIGHDSIIGAGSLLTSGTVVEPGSLVFGNPAKFVRHLTPEEISSIHQMSLEYIKLAKDIL